MDWPERPGEQELLPPARLLLSRLRGRGQVACAPGCVPVPGLRTGAGVARIGLGVAAHSPARMLRHPEGVCGCEPLACRPPSPSAGCLLIRFVHRGCVCANSYILSGVFPVVTDLCNENYKLPKNLLI